MSSEDLEYWKRRALSAEGDAKRIADLLEQADESRLLQIRRAEAAENVLQLVIDETTGDADGNMRSYPLEALYLIRKAAIPALAKLREG